jgi:hypothetical protein
VVFKIKKNSGGRIKNMFTLSQSDVNKMKKETLKDFGMNKVGKKHKLGKYKKLGYMK